jgi:transcriptional regulator with XRE-family HTH domain
MRQGRQERLGKRREKCPVAIERYVGSRIRLRRKWLGVTQQCLADSLGISFQQVQKYETGASCICAGRLHMIACALDVPVTFFFPAPQDADDLQDDRSATAIELLASSDAVELSLTAMQIPDPKIRRHLVELARTIAMKSEEAARPG